MPLYKFSINISADNAEEALEAVSLNPNFQGGLSDLILRDAKDNLVYSTFMRQQKDWEEATGKSILRISRAKLSEFWAKEEVKQNETN